MDCVENLTFEYEEQQAIGKHSYSDDEVYADFPFGKIDKKIGVWSSLLHKDAMLYDVLISRKILKMCWKEDALHVECG